MRFIFALMDSGLATEPSPCRNFRPLTKRSLKRRQSAAADAGQTHHHHSADVRSPRAIYRDFTAGLVLRVFLGTSRRS